MTSGQDGGTTLRDLAFSLTLFTSPRKTLAKAPSPRCAAEKREREGGDETQRRGEAASRRERENGENFVCNLINLLENSALLPLDILIPSKFVGLQPSVAISRIS
jgi:hypothetical protein